MKHVLRTIVLAKLQQPSAAAPGIPPQTPNWLRLFTLVEIAINNAPITPRVWRLFLRVEGGGQRPSLYPRAAG